MIINENGTTIDLNELIKRYKSVETLSNYLQNKKVTSSSYFFDQKWIFDTKPAKKIFSFSFNKKSLKNKNLELFWKLYIFLTTMGVPEMTLRNSGKIGHAYTTVTLFKFLQKINFPGNPPGSILFTPEYCDTFITSVRNEKCTDSHKRKKIGIVQVWYQINNYLPSFFQLPCNPFRGKTLLEIFPHIKDDVNVWKPIPSNDALFLVKEAIKYVEEHSDSILDIHEQWNNYSSVNPKINQFSAFGKYYDNSTGRNGVVNLKLAEIVLQVLNKDSVHHPLFNIWKVAEQLNSGKIGFQEATKRVSRTHYGNVLRSLYGACIILILFSTGMRKSEIYSLKRGCLDTISNFDIPLIENEVFKTDTGVTKIPISNIGAKAVRTLERLGQIVSNQLSGPLLVPVEKFKSNASSNKLANVISHVPSMIQKFCDMIGYGKAPHPHQFRHTLAAAVWERTEQAPVLLKILYNHSSLSMTLHYLRRNPFIKYAKKELFKRKYLPLVQQVVQYQKNNQIAGPASKRVKKMAEYITNNDEFAGKTEKELTLALEELFMSMIEQDQMRLFLTPFCVCMRFNSSASKSPCMLIEDHSDTVLATLPRTDRCVGSVCQDSLFTPLHQDTLNESMNFYENYLDQIPEDMKDNVLIAKVAQKEIKKYQKISWSLNNA